MAKFCTNCGAPLEEGMTTCASCGSEIEFFVKEEVADEPKAETTSNASSNTRYCEKCGRPISPDAIVCIHCGCAIGGKVQKNTRDGDGVGWGFLGFFLSAFFTPIIGLVLWLVWKDEAPIKAKAVGIGTLVALVVDVVSVAGILIWYFSFIGALISSEAIVFALML